MRPLLCGYKSYSALAEWSTTYGPALLCALGWRRGPCAATLYLIFRRLDWALLDEKVSAWAEEVLASTPARPGSLEAVACDGKALRGSRKHGARGTHLLWALSQRLGLTLGQVAVADKANEIGAIMDLLEQLILKGRVVTMDALLTQRAIAQKIVVAQGDYVMIAKDNQPGLVNTITALLATPPHVAAPLVQAQHTNRGHGRREERTLSVRAVQPGDCDWPGCAQVFRIERRVIRLKTGEVTTQTEVGLTSLTPQAGTPKQLLAVLRGHGHIENKSHWVRDVTFGEDRAQVRTGATPQVLATLRTTVIGLLRAAHFTNIAAAGRYFAARPLAALALLGVQLQN